MMVLMMIVMFLSKQFFYTPVILFLCGRRTSIYFKGIRLRATTESVIIVVEGVLLSDFCSDFYHLKNFYRFTRTTDAQYRTTGFYRCIHGDA